MRPLIFLNGPPRSGKDTLGRALAKKYRGFEIIKFAEVLKKRCHAVYGNHRFCHDYFEDCKDQPHKFFLGKTPREAYIAFSENLIKPLHGKDAFGHMLLQSIEELYFDARGFIITDSGFEEEAEPLLKRFGSFNALLVRIHGRGTFEGDSRSYLNLPIETLDVWNNASEATFLVQAGSAIDRILQPMLAGEFI